MSAALMALLACSSAQAEDKDTLTFKASETVQHDSNVFLRPASESGIGQRSETLSTSLAAVEIDKRYSLQRVELDASVSAYRYTHNDYLNFNALNYRAVWHWSLTPRLHGTLSDTRTEALNAFDYYRSFDRNVRTDHARRATGEVTIGGKWRLLGDVERARRTNERPTAQQGDFNLDSEAIGLRYLFPSGSNISYRMRDGRGDYFNRLPGVLAAPNAFDEREHELRVSWTATGKTTINARLAHLEREHPDLSVRNYAGLVGNVGMQWRATAKLGLQATLARDLGSYLTNTSSYATSNRVTLSPYWSIGPRTVLYASYDYTKQSFGGALPGSPTENRRDTVRGAQLGFQWKPIDALSLAATLYLARRSSNLEGFGFDNNTASLKAQFEF